MVRIYAAEMSQYSPNVANRPDPRPRHRPAARVPARWGIYVENVDFDPYTVIVDVVWPEKKQIGESPCPNLQAGVLSDRIGLIDSIFRNFYIPPVIFGMT